MNGFPRIAALSLIAAAPLVAQANDDRPKLDPDDVYKNNCLRCHAPTPQYPSGATQTMIMHMRVRANLTREETDAVLEYLAGGAPVPSPQARNGERPQKDGNDFLVAAPDPILQKPPAPQPPATQKLPARAVVEAAAPSTGTAPAVQPFIDAGLAAFKKRRFRQAETEFRKALEGDPSSAAAHFYLGYTHYKMVERMRPFHPGKQQAAALFAKAYELDPYFQPVWYMRR